MNCIITHDCYYHHNNSIVSIIQCTGIALPFLNQHRNLECSTLLLIMYVPTLNTPVAPELS